MPGADRERATAIRDNRGHVRTIRSETENGNAIILDNNLCFWASAQRTAQRVRELLDRCTFQRARVLRTHGRGDVGVRKPHSGVH